jgi:hypothetical protein
MRAIVVAGLLLSAAGGCTAPNPQDNQQPTPKPGVLPPPGDERPPIIIGDGSIDVYIDRDSLQNRDRGEFTVSSTGQTQVLAHVVDAQQYPSTEPASLEVFLTNALGSADCEKADRPWPATTFTVDYGPGNGNTYIMTVAIDQTSRNTTVTIEDTRALKHVQRFWKGVGARGDKLWAIRFNNGGSCSFDRDAKHRGIITVHQRN